MNLTLPDALAATIVNCPRLPAFLTDERIYTWGEAGDRIARLAQVLYDHGIRRGHRFAILARNSFRFEEAKWAGFWLGAVAVPVNWRMALPEIETVMRDCDARLMIVDPAHASVAAASGFADRRSRLLLLAAQPQNGIAATDRLLAAAQPRSPDAFDEESDALLLYTGGTTGRGKGVRLSHRNVLFAAAQIGADIRALRSDVYLHVGPMFHAADLLATAWLLRGASHAYLPAFTPEEFLGAIERYKVTITNLVPTVLIKTLTDPCFARHDISTLHTVLFGSASMTAEWVSRLVRTMPSVRFFQGYGLTETAPIVATLEFELLNAAVLEGRRPELIGSVGKPQIGISVRIVDDAGNERPRGEGGEIVVKGANIMKGYLNRPEETANALGDGWFHTGDFGKLDDDGNLFVLDRIKDMIITGGENVYSAEVETALTDLPGVREAAVFGIRDDAFGEAVCAAIIREPGAEFGPESVIEFCRARIAGYKIPRLIAFLDELPRTPIGKIAKSELRARFADRKAFSPAASDPTYRA